MKKYSLILAFFLSIFFGFSPISHALLSQSVSPDESWLTIYQNIDRAWVVEKVTLSLEEGENRFFLTRDNLLRERLFFHPLDPLTFLKNHCYYFEWNQLELRLKKPFLFFLLSFL